MDSNLFILRRKEVSEVVVLMDGSEVTRVRIIAEPVPVRVERRGNDTLILLDENK